MLLYIYGISVTVISIAIITYVLIGMKSIRQLKDQPIIAHEPAVAIIIAVRNEEEDLENALKSLCNINYKNHRLVVINDRSTDRTAEILAHFNHPKLTVITLDTLPKGWLGKNNALYQGYLNSTEEWMLFTDADIEFHPDAIGRAFGYVNERKLDHLAILPDIKSRSELLNSVLATFGIMLMVVTRPWDASKPNRSGSLGVGAFNLVKRTAYEQAGTHTKIKLRPDDDLKLGQNIKGAGLRQDVLTGKDYLQLEWYKNINQFINGLMKNTFAVGNYNVFRSAADFFFTIFTLVLPVPLMLLFGDNLLKLAALLLLAVQVLYMTFFLRHKWWYAFVIPFAASLMAYIVARSAFITLKQGGIYWRDTFYPLDVLKKG